ncbi:retrovirus-related pol polyprotein from transposon TNT 1-94 [Tanacetum coccineum]
MESLSSEDEGVTKVKAFMDIAENEPAMGKTYARSGQWVNIAMKKVHRLLSMNDGDERKHVLDYTNVDLHYVEDQRKHLLSKLNLDNESLRDDVSDLKKAIEKWTSSRRGKKKEAISLKEIVFTKGDNSSSKTSPDVNSNTESVDDNQEHLPSLLKLSRAKPIGGTEGYGSVNCNGITFTRVTYVNGLKHNLISISQLCDVNFKVLFTKTERTIFNQNNEVVLIAPGRRDVYISDISSYNEESNTCFFTKVSNSIKWLLHKRLSYLNFKNINKLAKQNIVAGLPSLTFSKYKPCSAYEKGKHHRASFKTKISFSVNKCLHLIHMNLFGPVKPQTISHNKYTLVIIDEYLRSIIVERHGKTTYDVFKGSSPDISYFHVFGCLVFIHKHIDHLGKFDEKADDAFFLGYSLVAKAFRVFNIIRQEMEETYHVKFNELNEVITQTNKATSMKRCPFLMINSW